MITAYIKIKDGYCYFKIPNELNLVFKISDSLSSFINIINYDKSCGLVTANCNYKKNEMIWQDEEYFDIKSILVDLGLNCKCLRNIKEVLVWEDKKE